MRLPLWPQSLFGRLLAASVIAVLLAQAVALFLIAQEREHFVLQGSVREWTRRIAETTLMLQSLTPTERAEAVSELAVRPRGRSAHLMRPRRQAGGRGLPPPERGFLRLPLLPGFETTLREHLHAALGPEYAVHVESHARAAAACRAGAGAVLRGARAGRAPGRRAALRRAPCASPTAARWCTA